ncbi:MAG: tRNA (adenosine(37)-N6)-threonylcarbamoyltransferase complex ATPase subunit type 1 TsaE [Victivallales bacterium]|nr:tRNA (adenosine(37)-N6)-threonylcarbamoyltransferase complex ATPase subunit type 1 TsaE [Victivallales bacterium]
MLSFISASDTATLSVGNRLAGILRPGTVVALDGDLGCGKTVISRGIARGMGITEAVTSPTFTVAQEYATPAGHYLYHLDMYRINDEEGALAFGIDEFLFNPDAITLIEWPERIAGLLNDRRLRTIRFAHKGENLREMTFIGWSDEEEKALAEIFRQAQDA